MRDGFVPTAVSDVFWVKMLQFNDNVDKRDDLNKQ